MRIFLKIFFSWKISQNFFFRFFFGKIKKVPNKSGRFQILPPPKFLLNFFEFFFSSNELIKFFFFKVHLKFRFLYIPRLRWIQTISLGRYWSNFEFYSHILGFNNSQFLAGKNKWEERCLHSFFSSQASVPQCVLFVLLWVSALSFSDSLFEIFFILIFKVFCIMISSRTFFPHTDNLWSYLRLKGIQIKWSLFFPVAFSQTKRDHLLSSWNG